MKTKLTRYLKSKAKKIISRFVTLPKSHMQTVAHFACSEAIEGDYLEFGVFKGSFFIVAYHALEEARRDWASPKRNRLAFSDLKNMNPDIIHIKGELRYFAFDSFQGLPKPKGIDTASARFSKGRYDCSEASFLGTLKKNGVNLDKVVTVPGWFDKSLNAETKKKYNLRKAAVVMIDCDLYESTVPVLDFITDLVVNGTILIFDDWYTFKGHPGYGERKATREWLQKNPSIQLTEYHISGPMQKSFIVNLV